MKIFVAGSTGFIGRALVASLSDRGHELTCAARRAGATRGCMHSVAVDFARDLDPEAWHARLAGCEVVVNAVGILRERGRQRFEAVHHRAPTALFRAAVDAGARRVLQISALGADTRARSGFHLGKRAADMALAALPVDWVVAQPSLVYGPGGASARLFAALASLPLIPVPRSGGRIQPIHIEDLVEALVRLIESRAPQRRVVPLVGSQAVALEEFLAALRRGLGLGAARFVHVPAPAMRLAAQLAARMPGSLLAPESLAMLERGNFAGSEITREVLGRAPRGPCSFIRQEERAAARAAARLYWALPPLRWSIAAVWIVSGVVSLAAYPVSDSLTLLARAGVPPQLAPSTLYAAAILDLVFGVATLLLSRRHWLWLAQLAVIATYTVILTLRLPELWAHPFGPVLKNLPLAAAIGLLLALERR